MASLKYAAKLLVVLILVLVGIFGSGSTVSATRRNYLVFLATNVYACDLLVNKPNAMFYRGIDVSVWLHRNGKYTLLDSVETNDWGSENLYFSAEPTDEILFWFHDEERGYDGYWPTHPNTCDHAPNGIAPWFKAKPFLCGGTDYVLPGCF